MPSFISPSSQRGTVTRWIVDSPWSRMTARVTRTIDIDGDEHWRVDIKRGDTWSPAPAYSGRNREAAERIRQEFDCVLFEKQELPPEPGEQSRTALRVFGALDRDEERSETFSGHLSPWEARS